MDAAEHEIFYRALVSRDRRFEGRFVAGITSTGIYCRPGCPAKTPREKNVRFFACAAAAEEAGFRACLRCRPDASATLPAAAGSSATVTRALQLLAQGEREGGLPALCDKLGVGERHLRRLFLRHLGASPIAVLRSQRLHFARALLEGSALPMPEVALAAGYQSTRRFNAEILRAFHRSPTELRGRALGKKRSLRSQSLHSELLNQGGNEIALRIPVAPPHDLPALLHFFASRAIAGVERVEAERYTRSIRLEGHDQPLVLSVGSAPRGDALAVRVSSLPPKLLPRLVANVRRMFGAHVLPEPVRGHLERDPLLRPAFAKHPGLRVPGAWDPFELAVRALLGQQISVRAAQTLAGRIVATFGEPLPAPLVRGDGPTHLFPSAATLAEAGAKRLSKLGVMPARAKVLEQLARAVADQTLDFEALRTLPLEQACAAIDDLPGFGPWSAHYIALRALGEPDAFPLKDLGLLRALQREKPEATFTDLEARAESWRPFRATAAIALWLTLSLDTPTVI